MTPELQNLLPDSFLKSEIRNDFIVDEKRKRLWAALLGLLREFQRVCTKNNLHYFAICGTALGAMRHQGFIPWDDDLDLAMPRKDYEKLKSLSKDFKDPYYLVWAENERENGYSFLKLRDSNTTGMSRVFANLNLNHGIYIDIFPLDEVSDLSRYEEEQAKIKELIIQNSNRMKALNNGGFPESEEEETDKLLQTYNEIERLATTDNGSEREYLALRTISFYAPAKMIWRKEVFREAIEVPFEFMSIKVPVGWRELLEVNYGEWQRFPPVEQRGTWHSSVVFDPNTPFVEYKNRNKA